MRLWFLPAVLLIFAMLSVLTLSSIAPQLAPRQLVYFFGGGVVFLVASRVDFRYLLRLSPILYGFTLISLSLVLILSSATKGAHRWFEIGDLKLQPSQLAIPFVGLFLAKTLENKNLKKLREFLLALLIVTVPGVLILLEPDLGTTLVFLVATGTIIFFKNLNWRYVIGLLGAVAVIGVLSWFYFLKPYQKSRISDFIGLSQEATSSNSNYNARQALIAVGSGELMGRGLGQGVQSHLRFLPERQTDFIFASLAEEFGFLGSTLLIGIYATLITFLIYTGFNSQNKPESLFCYMVASTILVQTSINIGMNMGLLPITGITLPLLSFGGSSILAIMGTLGMVQNVVSKQKKQIKLKIA